MFNQPQELHADVIDAMRVMADGDTSTRQVVELLRGQLGLGPDSLLPILWYFMKAFYLPLGDVLPIREWLGTDQDEEIDVIIKPAIARTKSKWSQEMERSVVTQR